MILGFALLTRILAAHPHVWVDMGVELVIEQNTIKGFWAEWSFDEMMTAMVIADVSPGQNNQFSSQSVQRIQRDYFQNLKNYNYFSYVWVDRKAIPINRVEQFQPSLINRRLFYRFFVPINVPIAPSGSEVVISMYDDTYWTDMGFRKNQPVRIRGISPGRVSFRLGLNPSRAYYGGMVQPEEVTFLIRPALTP
jgi:ABC-type uncharacterized transport system substrate-binding protein